MILDGYKGELIGNPSETVRQRYENTIREQAELIAGLEELKDLPCITADKHRVHLWVNTGLISDVARSLDQGAEEWAFTEQKFHFCSVNGFPASMSRQKFTESSLRRSLLCRLR